MVKRKVLILTGSPLQNDGLTKIVNKISSYNDDVVDFYYTTSHYSNEDYVSNIFPKGHVFYMPDRKRVFKYMQAVKSIVKTGNFSEVYIHGNNATMLFEALPARKGGAKYIITHCHNSSSHFPLINNFCKPIFNNIPDVKIAVSEKAAKWAYFDKYRIIRNGIDLKKFEFDVNKRQNIRKHLGISNKFIIGHVGRFTDQKNHKFLIDIFYSVYKKNKNACLLLIGDGPLKSEIEDKVRKLNLNDAVIFTGNVENASEYYSAMDCFCMPSIYEGFCIAAIEAEANGLPLVVANSLPEEALPVKNVTILSLEEKPNKWADSIISLKRNQSNNEILKKSGYDEQDMMKSIREVLLKKFT